MTDYAHEDTIEELRERYAELRETPLLLRASEDAEEFGGGYTLRLCTPNMTLHPGTLQVLAEHGLGVEYVGQPEDLHEWTLVESSTQ
ncbi:hypothetical protein HVTV-2_gp12 [Haloarcula virus HVTV-2]|uniref:Uncharacterized protein n=1 Tax=Haloarcula vallismortis tailed virus 1 TaxID=1262528 RepID=L7TJ16_9CAUD|nr:hypothetical protein HVTV1_12 [Haloarcula vallismortis tailed virus 1]AGC34383.1 hypothetical protein HVTV1_12 [Haloarcula vallismortis tailed virus 1]UBF22819.1 hypothetical protein HVTV-2_gp12 [Haloarcula virus HVTV-2]